MIGLGFTSDWMKKWREFLKPIGSVVDAKPKQMRITFDIQVKKKCSNVVYSDQCA